MWVKGTKSPVFVPLKPVANRETVWGYRMRMLRRLKRVTGSVAL